MSVLLEYLQLLFEALHLPPVALLHVREVLALLPQLLRLRVHARHAVPRGAPDRARLPRPPLLLLFLGPAVGAALGAGLARADVALGVDEGHGREAAGARERALIALLLVLFEVDCFCLELLLAVGALLEVELAVRAVQIAVVFVRGAVVALREVGADTASRTALAGFEVQLGVDPHLRFPAPVVVALEAQLFELNAQSAKVFFECVSCLEALAPLEVLVADVYLFVFVFPAAGDAH